jgi:hypothetical protein
LQQGFLVLAWEADPPEIETQKDVRFVFTDPDGDETVSLEMQVEVPEAERPGSRALFNQIIDIAGLTINRSGDHAFFVLVGGETKGRVSLHVHEPPTGGDT